MKTSDKLKKIASAVIGLMFFIFSSLTNSQDESFYESLKSMSIEKREAITVKAWKDGVYSEIKKEFKNRNTIEVFVEYGGAAITPLVRSHKSHISITEDYKKRPKEYRKFKNVILKKLPLNSYKDMEASSGDAMMLLEINEAAFDALQNDPMVTNYFLNEFVQGGS